MYTEAEAKTKWCPLARTLDFDGTNVSLPHNRVYCVDLNVVQSDMPGCSCIAAACMAWRVSRAAVPAKIEERELKTGAGPVGDGWAIKSSGIDEAEEGHPAYAWNIWSRETAPAKPELGFCGAFGPAKAGAA